MKNIIFRAASVCVLMANSLAVSAQYFNATVGGGISTLKYSNDAISSEKWFGGNVMGKYDYYLGNIVGISGGVGFGLANSKFTLNDILKTEMSYYSYADEQVYDYTYNAAFEDWQEKQRVYTVDIPIGAVAKYKFTSTITARAEAGVLLQVPFYSRWNVEKGVRTTSGYYSQTQTVVSNLPHQGFYTLEGKADGKLSTKPVSVGVYADLGIMHRLFGQTFYYGVYGSYGLTGMFDADSEREFFTQNGLYDSPLNTSFVDKAIPFSYGVKIGYVLPFGNAAIAEAATIEGETSEGAESSETVSE